MKIDIGRTFIFVSLVTFLFASACGGGTSTDWDSLPEYLKGGVVIYGDSRTGHDMHRRLVEGMASLTPEAVFHTGDLVTNGLVEDQWITFKNIVSRLPSGTPIYPALGNHEYESQYYFDNFDLPGNERWYLIDDIDGFDFIVLDSGTTLAAATTNSPASSQYQWLEGVLSSSVSPDDHTIVTFHYPLYSTGRHGSDEKDIADDLVPLFEKYGVDAVFNGHDHDYERSTVNGVRYIVSGGGGAPLRDQASTSIYSEVFKKEYHFCVLYFDGVGKLVVEAWNDRVQLIDQFEIENR